MLILALDTSSAGGSAALVRDGAIAIERAGDAARTHGERLPRELMELLDAARVALHDVDGFAVATGPGSFTGLRIGIATIQGLALAQGKLVTPISTFESLAIGTSSPDTAPVGVWIDAHRGEVFAALYAADGQPVEPPSSLTPEATLDAWSAAAARHPRLRFAGDGAVRYADVLRRRLGNSADIPESVPPLAGVIGRIASGDPSRAVRPHAVVPLYVRRSDAELARDRRRETGGT
jgi:tRNA threonylcarbamoyladenosine biosynthesis protein TsaB